MNKFGIQKYWILKYYVLYFLVVLDCFVSCVVSWDFLKKKTDKKTKFFPKKIQVVTTKYSNLIIYSERHYEFVNKASNNLNNKVMFFKCFWKLVVVFFVLWLFQCFLNNYFHETCDLSKPSASSWLYNGNCIIGYNG